jgi:hypothetical protein
MPVPSGTLGKVATHQYCDVLGGNVVVAADALLVVLITIWAWELAVGVAVGPDSGGLTLLTFVGDTRGVGVGGMIGVPVEVAIAFSTLLLTALIATRAAKKNPAVRHNSRRRLTKVLYLFWFIALSR